MRGTVTIAVPLEVTADQLSALATLLSAVEAGRWAYLANSFDRLEGKAARWPEPMALVLERLAVELRRAAAEREADATLDTVELEAEEEAGPELELEAEEEADLGRETVNVTQRRL